MATVFGAFVGLVILVMLTLVGICTTIYGLVKFVKSLFAGKTTK